MQARSRIAALMFPPSIWLALAFLLPLAIMAVFSFRLGSFAPQRDILTLNQYRAYFADPAYQRLLWQSTLTALETAFISVVLAYPLAHYLAFSASPHRLTMLTLLVVPAWTSYLLRILAWKIILGSSGALASLLTYTGLVHGEIPVLLYSRTAVLITLVYSWVPFVTLPIYSALERLDTRLLEAAADLGCAPWEVFVRVTLPLSMPGVAAAFFFVFIPTLGEWVTPSLVGGANGIMFGNVIQDQFVRALNWPLGSVMSLVMLAVSLVLTVLFSRIGRLTDLAGV
jgi:spermidine/putrescine transport system permease protein